MSAGIHEPIHFVIPLYDINIAVNEEKNNLK